MFYKITSLLWLQENNSMNPRTTNTLVTYARSLLSWNHALFYLYIFRYFSSTTVIIIVNNVKILIKLLQTTSWSSFFSFSYVDVIIFVLSLKETWPGPLKLFTFVQWLKQEFDTKLCFLQIGLTCLFHFISIVKKVIKKYLCK